MARFDAAVCIGRFQPLLAVHVRLIEQALSLAPRVVVVVGSAFQACTPKHPFTADERIELIRQVLPAGVDGRVQFLPQRDRADDTQWTLAVQRGVQRLLQPRGPTEPAVALVGHWRDPTSDYLHGFAPWTYVEHPRVDGPDATAVWDALYGAEASAVETALAGLGPSLPDVTRRWLQAWSSMPGQAGLADEWRHLQRYHAAWAGSPFAPVFVTVDAVLRCAGHVLLIRRGHWPGRGLFALPGGFIESRETVWQSALRELREETLLTLGDEELRATHRADAVFDRPDRSQRGRTITHALHFDLGDRPLPRVRAGDDAAAVSWVPIDALGALEDRFHDDHFQILEHFLGAGILSGAPSDG